MTLSEQVQETNNRDNFWRGNSFITFIPISQLWPHTFPLPGWRCFFLPPYCLTSSSLFFPFSSGLDSGLCSCDAGALPLSLFLPFRTSHPKCHFSCPFSGSRLYSLHRVLSSRSFRKLVIKFKMWCKKYLITTKWTWA